MRSCAKTSATSRFLRLLVLLGVEVGALPVLHRMASLPYLSTPGANAAAWGLWLRTTAAQDAVAALLRLAATGVAWWLLATTLLYLAARAGRVRHLAAAVEWGTPAPVRRLVDRALALSMVVTLSGGGAAVAATGGPPVPAPLVAVVGGRPGVLLPPGALPAATPQPPPPAVPAVGGAPAAPPPTDRQPPPAPPAGAPGSHRVEPGDSLWTIAVATVGRGDVGPYWREVVRRNLPALRSGNPNLIFPGETVRLPPTS